MLARSQSLLAALWAGVMLGLGALAAPAAFAALPSADAGRLAGRWFAQEAYLSLALAVLLLVLERRRTSRDPHPGSPSAFSANLALILGTLFCTVAGYFAVVPMMAAARAGTFWLSFGALHAVSGGFYLLKGLLVLVLAWRLGAAPLRTAATS